MGGNKPIGVFDTGVGGLSVVGEMLELLPQESIVYFADRARQPYGALPPPVAERLVLESLEFLVNQGAKALVIACNTAAAAGYAAAKKRFSLPIVSVIEPGVRTAAQITRNGRIGVIGTKGTIESGAHARALAEIYPEFQMFGQACPLLPPLIELGKLDTPETRMVVEHCLRPLQEQGIDTLVLGCTHFPFVRSLIAQTIGEDVRIVDPARETVRELQKILAEKQELNLITGEKNYRYIVSKFPETFQEVGSRLLGRAIPAVEEELVGEPVQGFDIKEANLYHPSKVETAQEFLKYIQDN